MSFWKSEDAEAQFGEVMHRALTDTRQTIMFPDRQAVVVMRDKDHHRYILAVQRLLELGETPPEVPERQEGEMGAWEYLESLQPPESLEDDELPEGFWEQLREDERHCECCSRRARNDRPADAA